MIGNNALPQQPIQEEIEPYTDPEDIISNPLLQDENAERTETNMNEESDGGTDEGTDEEESLKKRLELIQKRKKEVEEEKARLKYETEMGGEKQQPQTPVRVMYLTEGEMMRELLTGVQELKQWAVNLTQYLKSKGI